MPRISTFYAALAALALSANGASAMHLISSRPHSIHVPPPKGHMEINSFQRGVGRGINISSPTGGSPDREGKTRL
jgi:hypothetical protein